MEGTRTTASTMDFHIPTLQSKPQCGSFKYCWTSSALELIQSKSVFEGTPVRTATTLL